MSENGKTKRYEELGFTDDFMFCKILQNDPDLCRELTELILSRKIGRIVSIDRQKAIEITGDGNGVQFYVCMEDDESTVHDIEMQTTVAEDLPRRMRYYQGMIDLNMIERGARYKELKKSFIIFICLKNPYPEAGLHKYSIRSVCEEDAAIDFDDGIFKVILSARGDKGDVSDEMSKFLLYLTDQRTESDFTKRLNERVLAARSHEKWRREYMTLQERDERMREEGRKEGREEGRKGSRDDRPLFYFVPLFPLQRLFCPPEEKTALSLQEEGQQGERQGEHHIPFSRTGGIGHQRRSHSRRAEDRQEGKTLFATVSSFPARRKRKSGPL